MIDASQIDEYIEMWNDNLLGTDWVNDLVSALIKEREYDERLMKLVFQKYRVVEGRCRRLENALMTCAQSAGDDPFFNEGGEAYELLFGGKPHFGGEEE